MRPTPSTHNLAHCYTVPVSIMRTLRRAIKSPLVTYRDNATGTFVDVYVPESHDLLKHHTIGVCEGIIAERNARASR